MEAVRTAPFRDFETRNRLTMSDSQFRLLAPTPDECETFIVPGSWQFDPSTGDWSIDRVNFAQCRAARSDLCRPAAKFNTFQYDAHRPLGV